MGAHFMSDSITGTEAEIRKRFEEAQEADRYENGHSYSGGYGMATGLKFRRETFDTDDAADDWLMDHAEKWAEALAVKVKASGETPEHWRIGACCAS